MRKQDYLAMAIGRSLALQAKYKPEILTKLADHLVRETPDGYLEIADVLEDICDAYEKLGRMFYAKKIIESSSSETAYYHLVVDYHWCSFLFNCKSLLDSISNALYHAFDLDIKKNVNIDITRQEFSTKLAQKEPRVAECISGFEEWARYICDYRMALIHKYRHFGMVMDKGHKYEVLLEPVQPLTFFDKEHFDHFVNELKMRHGNWTVPVDDFCHEHLENAKALFEIVISEFLKKITRGGHDVFGWVLVRPLHMGEVQSLQVRRI